MVVVVCCCCSIGYSSGNYVKTALLANEYSSSIVGTTMHGTPRFRVTYLSIQVKRD